jgi:hypothetical protein
MPAGPPWHAVFALDGLSLGTATDYVDVIHAMDCHYLTV